MHISKEWFYTAYFALPWCLNVISPLSNLVIHKSRIKWLYLTNKTAVKTLKCNVSSSIEIWMLDCEGNTEYPRYGMEYYTYLLDKERNPSTKPNNNMKCTDYSDVLSYRREIGMCDEYPVYGLHYILASGVKSNVLPGRNLTLLCCTDFHYSCWQVTPHSVASSVVYWQLKVL